MQVDLAIAGICSGVVVPLLFLFCAFRVKRQTADQRIAEIQALIALAELGLEIPQNEQQRPVYGHGYVDPHNA